jgi:hypothetical protein
MTRVLLVGFTAGAADPTETTTDLDTVRTMIADGDAAVEASGYEVVRAWIGTDHDAGVAEVRRVLSNGRVDIVMVGNGVRGQPQYTELFEQVTSRFESSPTATVACPACRAAFGSG